MRPASIVVCGNPTIDEFVQTPRVAISPGGSALFASCAAAHLGARVAIIGNVGEDYPDATVSRLKALQLDVRLLGKTRSASTRFRITRFDGSRRLQLLEPGEHVKAPRILPFFEGVHLGPVFNEISTSLVDRLRKKCNFLSADLQGFIREVNRDNEVRSVHRDIGKLLRKCDMVQVSTDEAYAHTQSRHPLITLSRLLAFKMRYAIVTMGEEGSWLGVQRDRAYFVPAFPDRTIRDPTGAGDVFAGSWVHTILSTRDPIWASAVGSAFASLASRRTGFAKFRFRRRELFHRAGWVYNHVKPTSLSWTTLPF